MCRLVLNIDASTVVRYNVQLLPELSLSARFYFAVLYIWYAVVFVEIWFES